MARLTLLLFLCLRLQTNAAEEPFRILEVGHEITGEKLKLGTSVKYELRGLNPAHDYEIKISYPAFVSPIDKSPPLTRSPKQIPATFTLELQHRRQHRLTRRLLNVEKIIFSASEVNNRPAEVQVVVGAKPAGVVAKRSFKEQELVIYNIRE